MRIPTPNPASQQITSDRTAAVAGMTMRSLVMAQARRQRRAILALDKALEVLDRIDSRKARVVEMVYFGGLTSCEVATALRVPLATVTRDWRIARRWLRWHLSKSTGCRDSVGQSRR